MYEKINRIAGLGGVLILAGGCSTQSAGPNVTHADRSAGSDIIFSGEVRGTFGIHRYRHEGESPAAKLLIESANWPEPSPDGSQFLYQFRSDDGDLDIWLADIDGSNRRPVTTDAAHDYLPSWSPDGAWITFTSWRTEAADVDPAPHLYIMRADGREQRRLMCEPLGTSAGATWAPDGKSIVFSMREDDESSAICIATIDPDASEPLGQVIQLVHDNRSNGSPVFSPDGEQIAFYSSDDAGSQIVIIDRDGSNRRALVDEGFNWYPRWSSDGSRICFTRAVSDDQQDLDVFVVAVDDRGAPPRPVVTLPGRQAEGRFVE